MKDKVIATKMLKMASAITTPEAPAKRSKGMIARDFRECTAIVAEANGTKVAASKLETIQLDSLPGKLSPQQTRLMLARLSEKKNELLVAEKLYAEPLRVIKKLQNEAKEAEKPIRDAAASMKEKANYIIETEDAIVKWQTYQKRFTAGPVQIVRDPNDPKLKPEERAGGFFLRLADQLGDEIAESVQKIWEECGEDISYSDSVMQLFKITNKTASLRKEVKASVLKEAGIADMVTVFVDWLGGAADGMTKRIVNFAGDIKRWAKGFATRTSIVKNEAASIQKNLKLLEGAYEDYLKSV